uniref:adhesive domain-containing protein n=1 Tax=Kurthia senegalensis TaxID=1033740 RepID=UPI000288F1BD
MSKKNYSKWTKSAAASMLAFSLVATPYAISFGDQGANVSQKSASAAVLDIELLSNMTLTNDSGTTASNRFQLNPDGTQNVNFTVSGTSLAQASTITSGKKQVVLGVPTELQGLVQPNGNAQIDSSITLRINEVPLVAPVLDATDAVIGAVTKVISATPGISINIGEVYDKLDALNNIGEAGQGKFTAPLSINADGSVISAPIDDGLGLILAQNLNDALTDLNNAVQALTATGSGAASNLAAAALNTTLIPLKATVSAAVSTLKTTISLGGAIVNQLADAAVLGDTEIIVPTKVTGPAAYLNTNPTLDAGFVGSVVKGNVITLDLFKSSDGKSTVYYQGNPDDFAVPATPTDVATAGNSTDGYEVTGKAEANSDVTVYDKDGNKVGTGKADANGNFTISVPGSVGTEVDLTVTATNANGESDPASTKTPADPIVIPAAPTDVTTTGNSTDGYEVVGKAEPGATVNVYDKDGNKVGTGTAD